MNSIKLHPDILNKKDGGTEGKPAKGTTKTCSRNISWLTGLCECATQTLNKIIFYTIVIPTSKSSCIYSIEIKYLKL